MNNRISRFKPGVAQKTHLMLSAFFWSAIGILLMSKGFSRMAGAELLPVAKVLIVVSAFAAGSLKSFFILDKAARRSVSRILDFEDGTCLGAVYSIKTWGLVFCMMGLGVVVRRLSIPDGVFCFVYCAIGWALLLSSRFAWRVWIKSK